MAIEIVVPRLGWDMEEGSFGGWLKHDGEPVAVGDLLFTLESEKATEDIESLDAGILHISPGGPKAGDTVKVGAVIGFLASPGEPQTAPKEMAVAQQTGDRAIPTHPSPSEHHSPLTTHQPAISPRARRVAGELGVEWDQLQGSGRTGRIRERDVRAAAEGPAPSPSTKASRADESRPIPMTAHRKTIADRMLHSARSTAPVTLTTTADATNLVNLRNQFKAGPPSRDPLPSYTDFFVKLAALALPDHPLLIARRAGEQIVVSKAVHIGIAVDTEAGLVVPVVRDVPSFGLRQLAAQTRDFIERARRRALRSEDMQGGTFTVTSLGAFGIDAFTPIVNFPESAILGIGRIQPQPVVANGQIVPRDMVTLSLTFDHCVVDGAPAARFLQELVKLVENPGPSLIS